MNAAQRVVKENKLIILISISAFVLRLLYLSPWLEDWDSVSFAQALHNYSLTEHKPHPPGYPLYILLGRFFYLIFQDDTKALTFLSAVLGSASVLLIFLIARRMFGDAASIIASVLFIVTPVSWILSGNALTNIPGLFFLLVVVLLIYQSCQKPIKELYFAGFLSGGILGVRFTEAPVLVCLLLFLSVKRGWVKSVPRIAGFFCLGISVWLVPLLVITGPGEFLDAYLWIASYVVDHDAGFGASGDVFSSLSKRIESLWGLLVTGFTTYFIILSFAFLVFTVLNRSLHKKFNYQFLLIWTLSYFVPLLFVYNLEVPRYTLPLVAPLAILLSSFFIQLVRRSFIFAPALFLLAGSMFFAGYNQVEKARNLPPTVASVKYVKSNFVPEDTEIIASFAFRQFQYYAPEFNASYAVEEKIPSKKTVIVDHLSLKDRIEKQAGYKLISEERFQGDREVFPRIPEITIYALSRD